MRCACGSHAPPRVIIPLWLTVALFVFGIVPGIVALYGRRRLMACGACGRIRWQF